MAPEAGHRHSERIRSIEGELPGQEAIEDDTESILIRRRTDGSPRDLLRSHVVGSAHDHLWRSATKPGP